jgi:hypothetical protein
MAALNTVRNLVAESRFSSEQWYNPRRELLDIFNAEGVDTAFANTFTRYDLPHRSAPR